MSALLAGLCLATAPAHAQCVPDPASSGQTVTCSGNVANGFQAGGGIDSLTVNVLPGANVSDGGGAAVISVNDFNTITNSGTLAAGSSSTGIFAGVNNTITNTATGIITVVDDGSGIFVAGNSTVTNAGAITIGDTIGPAGGIFAINDFNTIINSAGATITGGNGAAGIAVQGDDARISNAGSIDVLDDAPGILLQGSRAVVTNSGHIIGGDDSAGIAVLGGSNTIINSGTITVGNGFASGIEVTGLFGSNDIINTGTINVGAGATGIFVSGDGTVFNSGTINAAAGFAAIEFCGCGLEVLTLGPGSMIQGFVFASGAGTLQLGGTGTDTQSQPDRRRPTV
jgi:hypothetical protein